MSAIQLDLRHMSEELVVTEQPDGLFHLLHRAEQRAKTLFAEESKGLNLTVRQLVILNIVAKNQGIMQTDIVSMTGIDRSTVTELVGRMVKRGLLTRQRNRQDARAYLVSVTDEGHAKTTAAEQASKKAGKRFLDTLPPDERCCFLRALTSVANLSGLDATELGRIELLESP